jgi:hypothetical protein
MPRTFAVHLPLEVAYVRKVLFAVEILDAVTQEPVTLGLDVSAAGLAGKPIVNGSGFFVWLQEGNLRPTQIVVDTGTTPYESTTVPVPQAPARSMRIELAPRVGYAFGSGATGVRGTIIGRRTGPRVPAAGAEVWLRWIDDTANGTTWVNAPVHSLANANGDFAAVVRLAPSQVPRTDASGPIRARLGARNRGTTRTSSEFLLPQGRVLERSEPFVWNEFQLSP